jgi:hypothetical protein
MTLWLTFSDGSIVPEKSPHLSPRVYVRATSSVRFTLVRDPEDYAPFRLHTERCERLTDDELIAELKNLKRSQRDTAPAHWSMWALTWLCPPNFLRTLELRAGELGTKDSDGARIRGALEHARRALGIGARSGGAPKGKRSKPTGVIPASACGNPS